MGYDWISHHIPIWFSFLRYYIQPVLVPERLHDSSVYVNYFRILTCSPVYIVSLAIELVLGLDVVSSTDSILSERCHLCDMQDRISMKVTCVLILIVPWICMLQCHTADWLLDFHSAGYMNIIAVIVSGCYFSAQIFDASC